MAIGLQELDHLKLSKYFEKLLEENINGDCNILMKSLEYNISLEKDYKEINSSVVAFL